MTIHRADELVRKGDVILQLALVPDMCPDAFKRIQEMKAANVDSNDWSKTFETPLSEDAFKYLVDEVHQRLTKNLKDGTLPILTDIYISRLAAQILYLSDDQNFLNSIIDGSWPTADEQIKKAREVRNAVAHQ